MCFKSLLQSQRPRWKLSTPARADPAYLDPLQAGTEFPRRPNSPSPKPLSLHMQLEFCPQKGVAASANSSSSHLPPQPLPWAQRYLQTAGSEHRTALVSSLPAIPAFRTQNREPHASLSEKRLLTSLSPTVNSVLLNLLTNLPVERETEARAVSAKLSAVQRVLKTTALSTAGGGCRTEDHRMFGLEGTSSPIPCHRQGHLPLNHLHDGKGKIQNLVPLPANLVIHHFMQEVYLTEEKCYLD